MAQYIKHSTGDMLYLTEKEAVDIIALLVGLLANKQTLNHQMGQCPEVMMTIVSRGRNIRKKLGFVVSK